MKISFVVFMTITALVISGCASKYKQKPLKTFTITASVYGHGKISPAGVTTVPAGGSQTYTFTPDPNYTVRYVKVDHKTVLGPMTNYTFDNVNSDQTIYVSYQQIRHTVTSSAGPNGYISPSGNYNFSQGSSPRYKMNPDKVYHVADVLVDGISVGAEDSYTFENLSAPHTITVSFAINPTYTITATVTGSGSGSITPAGAISIRGGLDQKYTITPDPGSKIDAVFVNSVNKGPITSFTFWNVDANKTIEVRFTPN